MAAEKRPNSDTSIASRLTRRRLLALSGAASAGLAGCSGSPEQSSPTAGADTTTEGPQTTVKQEGTPVTTSLASHRGSWEPSKTNMNRYAPAGNEPPWLNYLWFEGTIYRNNKGELIYLTIDDVSFEQGGKEVVFNFNENFQWWDGTQVTAEDYLIQRQIGLFQQYGSLEEAPITLEQEDDFTVREIRSTPVNPSARLLQHTQALYTKRDIYREWLEKYKDAGGSDAVEQVTSDLTKLQIPLADAVEQGYGMSMFKPTEWNPNRVTLEKFSGHPRSDWTNLETWTWELVSGDQKFDQAFKSGRFDMGELNFDLVAESDTIENVAEFPLPGVPKLTMNFQNKHLGRRGVRRAIAYLIDHDEIRQVLRANFGTPYKPHPEINGMAKPVGTGWVGSDYLDSMLHYGAKAQPEKARQALQNEGYTKEGDRWVGPDGDAIEGLKYTSPPWGIYQKINKYLAPILTDFGIGTESVLPSRSNFYKRLNETFNFDMVNWFHFGFHPTTSYNVGQQFGPTGLDNYRAVAEPVENIEDTPTLNAETSPRLGHPIRPTFPSEVGAKEVSGDGQTLFPIKWLNIVGATQDRERVVDLTKKLSWYYNWQIPHIGFYEEVWNYWAKTDTFTFRGNHPDTETDRTEREHTIPNEDSWQVMLGHVSARLE